MPQPKTVVRSTDAILRGEEPLDPEESLTKTGWLERREGELVFGPTCGDVVGLSVKRESLAWTVAGLTGPIASGRIDADILPIHGESASPEELESHLLTALAEITEHLPQGRIGAIGVAWPGPIAPDGEPRDYPHHHSGLRDPNAEPTLPLTPIVKRALIAAGLAEEGDDSEGPALPVIAVIKDADADMLFEMRHGVARGFCNVMGLKVCGGIGMSIVHDGRLIRGGNGAAGEIQHIRVRIEEEDELTKWGKLIDLDQLEDCPCSGTECVGKFASGSAIIDQLANYFEDSEQLTPNQRGRRIEAGPGDAVINGVCERAGRLLGQAIVGPVVAFDPELLVVSAFPRSEALVDGLRSRLKGSHAYLNGEEDVVAGTADCETTAMGAARLVIEESIVPRIDREVPSASASVPRWNLPAWLRRQVPAEVKDVGEHPREYGQLSAGRC